MELFTQAPLQEHEAPVVLGPKPGKTAKKSKREKDTGDVDKTPRIGLPYFCKDALDPAIYPAGKWNPNRSELSEGFRDPRPRRFLM